MSSHDGEWKKNRLHPGSVNCIAVQTGDGGRHITRIRGDDAHPARRVMSAKNRSAWILPERRRPPHLADVAQTRRQLRGHQLGYRHHRDRAVAIRSRHGGESILYYGGAGQGNHVGGAYADSFQASSAMSTARMHGAGETGEFWCRARCSAPVRMATRALRSGAVHRQEPLAVTRLCACARIAARSRRTRSVH